MKANELNYDYDMIGVGLGPFNLSLAALLEEERLRSGEGPRALFLEAQEQFNWHPGMILPGTTLQVPFMADLVTMADPTSRFTFLNYLHEQGRLYNFYFYENFKVLRKEYNAYCRWVSEQLSSTKFGARVLDIRPVDPADCTGYRVYFADNEGQTHSFSAKHLVLGYGTSPALPEFVEQLAGDDVMHTARFAGNREGLRRARRAVVIGSGQSAGECALDILNNHADVELHWYTRSQGFLPMEYSKLGLEFFSPEYIDYFHGLSEEQRDRIRGGQDLFYKGMSGDTIAEIYDALYERSLDSSLPQPVLQGGVALCDIQRNAGAGEHRYQLELRHNEEGAVFGDSADFIVLGTGYAHRLPEFTENLVPTLQTDSQGRLEVTRDYRAKPLVKSPDNSEDAGQIFIQNGEIHSHGIGAPDLGLGAYRSAMIVNQLLGREAYRIRRKNVFQAFGRRGVESLAHEPIGG